MLPVSIVFFLSLATGDESHSKRWLQALEFVVVTDLDHKAAFCGSVDEIPSFAPYETPSASWNQTECSSTPDSSRWWLSLMRKGVLRLADSGTDYSIEWLGTTVLKTQTATRGRSMELSDVVRFRHLLLAMCDITGIVHKLRVADGSVFQRYAIADGNGEVPKPFKIEWATRKDGAVLLGSVGKSLLDFDSGAFVNRDSEWIKTLKPSGLIENSDWGPVYSALRRAAGVGPQGYLWHEAVEWDSLSRRWIFMPRKRALRSPFEPVRDERMGTNVLLVADEHFRKV